ncbi:MAG: WG repeat-containing protein [Clostridia bacterium]|nr:WG repeat-containing protein [Clostridia bacterium]
MRRLLSIVLALLVLCTCAAAEEPTLWPSCDDASGLWGYIDEAGAWAIAPQFGRAYHFHGGCAIVDIRNVPDWEGECTQGVIDETGAYLLEPEYDIDDACCYYGAGLLYLVNRWDDDWQSGWFNIPNRHFSGLHWTECLALTDTPYILVNMDYSISGLADRTTGEIVLPAEYSYTGLYDWGIEDGFIVAEREDTGECELIELGVGAVELPDGVTVDCDPGVTEGLVCFRQEGLYGYLNTAGEIVIPAQYDRADGFVDGYACVSVLDEPGFSHIIDREGNIVLRFADVRGEESGQYTGMVDGALFVTWQDGSWSLIEPDGTVRCHHALPEGAYDVWLWEFAPDGPIWVEYVLPDEESAYALMTREGVLGDPRWTRVSWNAGDPWLAVSEDCTWVGSELVGTWGYADEYGNEVLPAVYAWAEPFEGALARVRFSDAEEGYINRAGEAVIRWAVNGDD